MSEESQQKGKKLKKNESEVTEQPKQEIEEEQQKPKNTVTIEDSGPCKKKVIVEIPPEAILQETDKQYKDLMKEAVVPGFRKGRAPRRLLEKRFGKEATEQIKVKLLSDASDSAIKDNKLKILGEPDIDIETIELPEEGPMKFDFQVEVRPEFELPSLEGITITQKTAEVTDEQVKERIEQMQKWSGVWTPRDSGFVELDDQVIADVVLKIEGVEEEQKLESTEIFVRHNGFVGQITVENLDELLIGAKAEQTKETTVDIPKTYFKEEYRGKKIDIKITIKDIKTLDPAELNEDFFKQVGVADLADLQQKIKQRLQHQLAGEIQEESAEQIYDYLDKNINFDLPLDVVAEQADSVLRRQYVNMLMKGFQKEQVAQQLDHLKASSEEQAKKQLKTFFIMDKVADSLGIEVTEEEINGQIASAAIQQGQRPEKLRHQMEHEGTLAQFSLQIRQEKCIAKLLETAKITQATPEEKPKKAAKKTGKKTKKSADEDEKKEDKE